MLRRQLCPLSVIHDLLITEPSFKEGVPSGILNFALISPPGDGATPIRIPLQLLHIFASHEIKTSVLLLIYAGLVVRVPGYRSRGPGSIPGTTSFSAK
jgi:hypothetical protein